MKFCRDNTGKFRKEYYQKKYHTNKNAVPLFNVNEIVTLKTNSRSYICKRTQIPLDLVYTITSYSTQGITKERQIIDYGSNKEKQGLFFILFRRAI